MKFYLDSNVFIARLLGDFGKQTDFMEGALDDFLLICFNHNYQIVLSDLFFYEIEKKAYTSRKEVFEIINRIANVNLIEINSISEDKIKSKK